MNVTELINFIGLFVFGRNNSTLADRVTYLSYLNLADSQFYTCTKNSTRILQETDLYFPAPIPNAIPINYAPLPPNYIAGVYTARSQMKYVPDFYNTNFMTINYGYYFLNNNIYVNLQNLPKQNDPSDGVLKSYVKLITLPLRKILVENITNSDLETNVPIYPESYQLGLVHGAVYFLFLSQKGFTEKIQYALKDWELAKSNLTAYYTQDK